MAQFFSGTALVKKGDIAMMIGDNGKITQFHYLWKNIAFGNHTLISVSPEQPIEDMRSHTSSSRSTAEIQSITNQQHRTQLLQFTTVNVCR